MRLTESQFVRMTRTDKHILLKLAELEERTPSDVIRRLIRLNARRRGLSIQVSPAVVSNENSIGLKEEPGYAATAN